MSNQLVHLHRFIAQRYNLDELKTLCVAMGIEYEDLSGWTRSAKVRELILQIGKKGHFKELLKKLEKDRLIPFKQAGLSTDNMLVKQLNDDYVGYRELSKPLHQKIEEQLQLDVRRVLILVLLLFAAVISTAGFLYFGLRDVGDRKMNGDFKIAITEFGEVDENGRVRASDVGKELSATIFKRVEDEMGDLLKDRTILVWHNEADPQPGVNLHYLSGDTAEDRSVAAANLAKEINADLIIYGNFRLQDQSSRFLPEFYVSEFSDAPELIGAHTLGSEIQIQAPPGSRKETFLFNDEISARTNALTLFAIGLTLDSVGEHEQALTMFRQAEMVEGWDDNEGKEVLYLFIARAANSSWENGKDRGAETLAAAQRAIELNPQYGRAYIGLGNYHRYLSDQQYAVTRSLRKDDGKLPDTDAVRQANSRFTQEANQAVRNYHQALDNLPETAGRLVEIKVHLALGGVHNQQAGQLSLLGDYDVGLDFAALALEENEKAYAMAEEDDYRHRALAQLGMAVAYHHQANTRQQFGDAAESRVLYEKALASYDACIALAEQDPYQSDWYLQKFKEKQCVDGRRTAGLALDGL